MTEQIPSLKRAAADYVHAFNIAAICAYRDGRIGVSRNPAGAAAAWWVEARETGQQDQEAAQVHQSYSVPR